MNINELNTFAGQLNALGGEHLGINAQGNTVPATSSLAGRFVNWVRSRHSEAAAQGNRDVMQRIISTIRQTEGLGDRFADIAAKKLESRLAEGRPLSGRGAAQVIQDIVRIKNSEDTARMENCLLNVRELFQAFCSPHADGSPSDMETCLADRRQFFGLSAATPEKLAAYRDAALRDLESAVRSSNRTLTPAECRTRFEETARAMSKNEAEAGIADMVKQVCGEDFGGFTSRLDASMRAKGFEGTISPSARDALIQTFHEKLIADCLNDSGNVHQPTQAEAAAAADKIINGFVDALDTVEHSPALSREAKNILLNEILHSSVPVNTDMAQAICRSLADTGQFLRSLIQGNVASAVLKRDFDACAQTMDAAVRDSNGALLPGIGGAPEIQLVHNLAARSACRMLGLGNTVPLTEKEKEQIKEFKNKMEPLPAELAERRNAQTAADHAAYRAVTGGSSLHALRYDIIHDTDTARSTRNNSMLMNMLSELIQASESEVYFENLEQLPGLGQMSMADARRIVPQGIGLPEGQAFDMAAARQKMLDGINYSVLATPPRIGGPLDTSMDNASPELRYKCSCFSDQFLRDFVRGGIFVNGNKFGAGGHLQDLPWLEKELDALIAMFPSPEEAGRVCGPLHQAGGADMINILMMDPATAEETMRIVTLLGKSLSNNLVFNIIRHPDNSYHIYTELGFQNADPELGPRASSGYNVSAVFTLPNGREPLQFGIESFDVLFNVTTD